MPTDGQAVPVTSEEFFDVDFSKANEDPPNGILLLKCEKVDPAISQAGGNRMLNVQLRVMDGEGGKYNKRVLFDNWMLETDAVFKTKQAAKAFLGEVPNGPARMSPAAFLQANPVWCLVTVRPANEEEGYAAQGRVKKYGVKPPAGASLTL